MHDRRLQQTFFLEQYMLYTVVLLDLHTWSAILMTGPFPPCSLGTMSPRCALSLQLVGPV